jgi:hypothetical protein
MAKVNDVSITAIPMLSQKINKSVDIGNYLL